MPYYKQIQLFDNKGYLNAPGIIEYDPLHLCWIFVVLGRATGKTFGVLEHAVNRAHTGKGQFIYMRRTQDQCDLISKPELSPIQDLNRELGWNLLMDPVTKKNSGVFDSQVNKDGILVPTGPFLGLTAGLSTFRNLRGLSLRGVSLMIYDEFVPERTERPLRNEGFALKNAYETVNRNRELAGEPPLICICLGNADDLGNRVFMDLGWTDRAEWMVKNGRECYYDYGLRTAIYIPRSSPISEAKKGTALYQMSGHDRFSQMALENKFAEEGIPFIKAMPIREYNPIVALPGICIYRHKDRAEYYATTHKAGSPEEFQDSGVDLDRFRRKYIYLWEAYMRERITFESYSVMRVFENVFGA